MLNSFQKSFSVVKKQISEHQIIQSSRKSESKLIGSKQMLSTGHQRYKSEFQENLTRSDKFKLT